MVLCFTHAKECRWSTVCCFCCFVACFCFGYQECLFSMSWERMSGVSSSSSAPKEDDNPAGSSRDHLRAVARRHWPSACQDARPVPPSINLGSESLGFLSGWRLIGCLQLLLDGAQPLLKTLSPWCASPAVCGRVSPVQGLVFKTSHPRYPLVRAAAKMVSMVRCAVAATAETRPLSARVTPKFSSVWIWLSKNMEARVAPRSAPSPLRGHRWYSSGARSRPVLCRSAGCGNSV